MFYGEIAGTPAQCAGVPRVAVLAEPGSAVRGHGELDVGVTLRDETPRIDAASTVPRGVDEQVGQVAHLGLEDHPVAHALNAVLVVVPDDDTLATTVALERVQQAIMLKAGRDQITPCGSQLRVDLPHQSNFADDGVAGHEAEFQEVPTFRVGLEPVQAFDQSQVGIEEQFDLLDEDGFEKATNAGSHARIALSEWDRHIHLEAPVCVGARERSLYYTKL